MKLNLNLPVSLGIAVGVLAAIHIDAHAEPSGKLLLRDDYRSDKLKQRRALRGAWKISDGVAVCTQDDALYKKYKNHGPIIFYDVPHRDAVIRFQYRAEKTKMFVFTVNGETGHVFRFVTSDRGTQLRGFPPEGDKKSIALKSDAKKILPPNKWNDVTVTLRGDKATVQIGKREPLIASHPSLARPKKNISLGFSFGTFSIKDFSATK